ncbi:hypothetical protein B296_00022398 [Ensete ventricosum]|uniref:Uncharacterized protein n=1 Tax=Ensete ventricosum TaxID=4639 RepID=A0A427A2R8_ENSVE|nr:hypothetical protein B296_00022398 [Ensete ventricosum]
MHREPSDADMGEVSRIFKQKSRSGPLVRRLQKGPKSDRSEARALASSGNFSAGRWLRYAQCVPHRRRCIDNVVGTWWRVVLLGFTDVDGAALVDDLRQHGPPVGADSNVPVAPAAAVEPSGGQGDGHLGVVMVLTVARPGASAVAVDCETDDHHLGRPVGLTTEVATGGAWRLGERVTKAAAGANIQGYG